MPLSLSAVVLLASVPLWAAALGLGARRAARREAWEREAAAEAALALDEAVTAIAWAFDVEVSREPEGASASIRGTADGQRFELELGARGWLIGVDIQPVLPAGVEVRAIDAGPLLCATSEAAGERVGVGHPGFDANYFVVPPQRGDRVPPAIIEALGRRPIAGLRLVGDHLGVDACGRTLIGARPALLASLRGSLQLARELEALASRRPTTPRDEP